MTPTFNVCCALYRGALETPQRRAASTQLAFRSRTAISTRLWPFPCPHFSPPATMIAKAQPAMRDSRRPALLNPAKSPHCGVLVEEQTEVWNRLFLGSLRIQRAKLTFHNCNETEVITVVALDLRADGWVVTGLRLGSAKSIEHTLESIRGVEILGDASSEADLFDTLPPLA